MAGIEPARLWHVVLSYTWLPFHHICLIMYLFGFLLIGLCPPLVGTCVVIVYIILLFPVLGLSFDRCFGHFLPLFSFLCALPHSFLFVILPVLFYSLCILLLCSSLVLFSYEWELDSNLSLSSPLAYSSYYTSMYWF